MEKEGKITIQLNSRGEIINVEIDGKRLTKPTHKLAENPPPGVLKGISDIGQIYYYEKPDGKRLVCFHIPFCELY
jgi:hypothetical protein